MKIVSDPIHLLPIFSGTSQYSYEVETPQKHLLKIFLLRQKKILAFKQTVINHRAEMQLLCFYWHIHVKNPQ